MEQYREETEPVGKYKPLSPWAYFGYSLLFSIPLVGFILLIVFSFSDENINRRNYARSFWCALIIVAVIVAILFATGSFAALTALLANAMQ